MPPNAPPADRALREARQHVRRHAVRSALAGEDGGELAVLVSRQAGGGASRRTCARCQRSSDTIRSSGATGRPGLFILVGTKLKSGGRGSKKSYRSPQGRERFGGRTDQQREVKQLPEGSAPFGSGAFSLTIRSRALTSRNAARELRRHGACARPCAWRTERPASRRFI